MGKEDDRAWRLCFEPIKVINTNDYFDIFRSIPRDEPLSDICYRLPTFISRVKATVNLKRRRKASLKDSMEIRWKRLSSESNEVRFCVSK